MPLHSQKHIDNYIGFNENGLKLCHLNINRFVHKLDQLKCSLLCNNPKIDICGFSETFLTNRTNNTFFEVEGYQIFRRNRDTRLGGEILVYVNDKWKSV